MRRLTYYLTSARVAIVWNGHRDEVVPVPYVARRGTTISEDCPMQIYILRHGIAEDAPAGKPDSAR